MIYVCVLANRQGAQPTEHNQVELQAFHRHGRYLALVDAGVLPARPSQLQRPLGRLVVVQRLKPLVRRERVRIDGQYVQIMMAHPGDAVLGQIFHPARKECGFAFPHRHVAGNAQIELRFGPLVVRRGVVAPGGRAPGARFVPGIGGACGGGGER